MRYLLHPDGLKLSDDLLTFKDQTIDIGKALVEFRQRLVNSLQAIEDLVSREQEIGKVLQVVQVI